MVRRSVMVWSFAPVLAFAGSLVGCNEDATPSGATTNATHATDATNATDTTTSADATTGTQTTVAPDTTASETTVATHVTTDATGETEQPGTCDLNGFTAASQAFESEPGFAHLSAVTSENAPFDAVSIEIYSGDSYPDGATTTGTYSLNDSNYATCANCVLVKQGCGPSGCDKIFYADKGDLVITQWDAKGGHFKGRLDGAVLHEVTIDPDSFLSTLVPGGKSWCLGGFEFDGTIVPLPTSDKTQPECVTAGTGTILHDNVKDIELKNCNGARVSLHASCGASRKAMWLIGTTGWCTACHEFLANLAQQVGGSISRDSVNANQPGLDMLILLAENEQGAPPTEAYCKQYAAANKVDPAMVLIDSASPAVNIPLIDEPQSAVSVTGLGNIWQVLDPYLTADSSGTVTTGFPWWALLRSRNMEYYWSDFAQEESFDEALSALLSGQ